MNLKLQFNSFSRGVLLYLILMVVLVSLVWSIAYDAASREKSRRIDASTIQAQRLAAFFEQHTLDFFRYGDSYLKLVRNEYLKTGSMEKVASLMKEVPLNKSIASHVTIIDSEGVPIFNSAHKLRTGVSAKDREYFKYQKNMSGDRILVSLPHKGRNSGKLIIRLVRRFEKPNGEFGGVIFVAMDEVQVTNFFNSMNLGSKSSATLVGLDKRIRARSSYGRVGPGQDISGSRLWSELEKSPVGIYQQVSVVDDITRFYAYRRLDEFPLIVAIGVSTEDILSAYAQSAQKSYAIASLVTLLIVISTLLILRQTRIAGRLAASEMQTRTIVETVPDGLVSINHKGKIESFNKAAEDIFGYQSSEVIGKNFGLLTPLKDREKADSLIGEFLDSGRNKFHKHNNKEITALKKNGEHVPIELSVGELIRSDKHVFVASIRDITDKKAAEKALSDVRTRALVTLQSIGDAVISTDAEGRIEFINAVAETLTGWSLENSVGKRLGEVFTIIDENSRELIEDPVQRCLRKGDVADSTKHSVLINRSGKEFAIEDSAAPIRDDDGRVLGVVLVFKDVSEARQLSQKIFYQASHDSLTGLVNRQEFERRLKRVTETAVAENTENVFGYLDLDRFKLINDSCGHVAGDELLRQISELVDSNTRQRDTLGRLGGDEFGLLMEHCSIEEAQRIAQKLVDAVNNHLFIWEENSFRIGVSIGLVTIVNGSGNVTEVLKAADAACYTAKSAGHSSVHTYEMQDAQIAERNGKMQWAIRIPRALENNDFQLFYQMISPLVEVAGETSYYYEVLLRLHDDGQLILPDTFLPAAERYNLAVDIDKWVVKSVFQQLYESPEHIANLGLCSINLSGHSFSDSSFQPYIVDLLKQYPISPQKLCFEITETAAISNLTSATRFINAMKDLGFRFALDDFGTGLSSFAYLKNLPVDILKIDGMFVKEIVNDPLMYAMVKSINEIGHIMGKQTIAEFVESDELLQKIRQIGVDYAQGYEIAKPGPLINILQEEQSKKVLSV